MGGFMWGALPLCTIKSSKNSIVVYVVNNKGLLVVCMFL